MIFKLIKELTKTFFHLFIISLLIFLFMKCAPGKPFQTYFSKNVDTIVKEKDENLIKDYITFTEKLYTFDWGNSDFYFENNALLILSRLNFSVIFGLLAFIFQFTFTFVLLYIFYKFRLMKISHYFSHFFTGIYSIPIFLLSLFLIFLFSYLIPIFPYSYSESQILIENINLESLINIFEFLILPILSIAIPGIAIFYNYISKKIILISNSTFIKYLEFSSFSAFRIFFRHILPHSLSSLLRIIGIELGFLITGLLFIEIIFNLPGIGSLTYTSIIVRDLSLMPVSILVTSFVILLLNNIFELLQQIYQVN